jgi:hypothetical protein
VDGRLDVALGPASPKSDAAYPRHALVFVLSSVLIRRLSHAVGECSRKELKKARALPLDQAGV